MQLFADNIQNLPEDFNLYDRSYKYDSWDTFTDIKIGDKKFKFTKTYDSLGPYFYDIDYSTLCLDSYNLYKRFNIDVPTRFMLPMPLKKIDKSKLSYSTKDVFILSNIKSNFNNVFYDMAKIKNKQNSLILSTSKLSKIHYPSIYFDTTCSIVTLTEVLFIMNFCKKLIVDGINYSTSLIYNDIELYKDFINIKSEIESGDKVIYDLSKLNIEHFNLLSTIPKGYFEKYILNENPIYDIHCMLDELILSEVK